MEERKPAAWRSQVVHAFIAGRTMNFGLTHHGCDGVQPRAHHVAVHIARLDAVHRRLHQLARPGTGDQWLPRCAVSRAPCQRTSQGWKYQIDKERTRCKMSHDHDRKNFKRMQYKKKNKNKLCKAKYMLQKSIRLVSISNLTTIIEHSAEEFPTS